MHSIFSGRCARPIHTVFSDRGLALSADSMEILDFLLAWVGRDGYMRRSHEAHVPAGLSIAGESHSPLSREDNLVTR